MSHECGYNKGQLLITWHVKDIFGADLLRIYIILLLFIIYLFHPIRKEDLKIVPFLFIVKS